MLSTTQSKGVNLRYPETRGGLLCQSNMHVKPVAKRNIAKRHLLTNLVVQLHILPEAVQALASETTRRSHTSRTTTATRVDEADFS